MRAVPAKPQLPRRASPENRARSQSLPIRHAALQETQEAVPGSRIPGEKRCNIHHTAMSWRWRVSRTPVLQQRCGCLQRLSPHPRPYVGRPGIAFHIVTLAARRLRNSPAISLIILPGHTRPSHPRPLKPGIFRNTRPLPYPPGTICCCERLTFLSDLDQHALSREGCRMRTRRCSPTRPVLRRPTSETKPSRQG